jgi:hypothetical protein
MVMSGCFRYTQTSSSSEEKIGTKNIFASQEKHVIERKKTEQHLTKNTEPEKHRFDYVPHQENTAETQTEPKEMTKESRVNQPTDSEISKKRRKIHHKTIAKRILPKEETEYIEQETKLRMIQQEIEASGYVLNQEDNPEVLRRDPLAQYEGFRITFRAKDGKYLPPFEKTVERNLEEKFAKNFRRIYRGKMSRVQEGIYVIDFIPQEYLPQYKQDELR